MPPPSAAAREGLYQCNNCREQFTVTVGTVFERSKIAAQQMAACAIICCASSKKGMSAHQIHRMLGVTYKTAWFMCHRIREAMKHDGPARWAAPARPSRADETFVGGNAKNRAFRKLAPKKKSLSRWSSAARRRPVSASMLPMSTPTRCAALIVTNVNRDIYLMTDDARVLCRRRPRVSLRMAHVDHAAASMSAATHSHQHGRKLLFHLQARRHRHLSPHERSAHCTATLAEFDFRYNTRLISDRERADNALIGIAGKRLTYRRTDCARSLIIYCAPPLVGERRKRWTRG